MKELSDKLKSDGWQHFTDENTTTTEFSEDVIFSIRTEELTREEIIKKYNFMGYEPQLIIKFDDLKSIKHELEEESKGKTQRLDLDEMKVADFLLFYLENEHIQPLFLDTRIIVTEPSGSHFNSLVRKRLDEGDVYYVAHLS